MPPSLAFRELSLLYLDSQKVLLTGLITDLATFPSTTSGETTLTQENNETAFAPRESADDLTMASASSPFTGGTPTNLGRIDVRLAHGDMGGTPTITSTASSLPDSTLFLLPM